MIEIVHKIHPESVALIERLLNCINTAVYEPERGPLVTESGASAAPRRGRPPKTVAEAAPPAAAPPAAAPPVETPAPTAPAPVQAMTPTSEEHMTASSRIIAKMLAHDLNTSKATGEPCVTLRTQIKDRLTAIAGVTKNSQVPPEHIAAARAAMWEIAPPEVRSELTREFGYTQ